MKRSETRKLLTGVGFIAPNIIGFLIFTLLPLVMSLIMAFTNWDIRLHNMFTDSALRFVGFDNFIRLFQEPYFLQSLQNTLFLMMGIPLGVGGSLCAALLLSADLRAGRVGRPMVLAGTGLLVGIIMMLMAGGRVTSVLLLVFGLAGLVVASGIYVGKTVYRTLFYFPHFTAGVATFLLWKKLYNPHTGPVNAFLRAPLAWLGDFVNSLPPAAVQNSSWAITALAVVLVLVGARRAVRARQEGDLGTIPMCAVAAFLLLPCALAVFWSGGSAQARALLTAGVGASAVTLHRALRPQPYPCLPDTGLSRAMIEYAVLMVALFICVGMSYVFKGLPAMAAEGLAPPEWLTQYHWAKPALMIMGFWAAFGSNNMLLYLAGISNIPPDLYEAADIDGAAGMQRFWNITWPQLAPVTFFILVMSTIGGLQGGFEQARTMTQGGPARATTTLSYYVYQEGFDAGRLGYASAVAWALFLLVFAVTLFNWKFGNRRVND